VSIAVHLRQEVIASSRPLGYKHKPKLVVWLILGGRFT
jgi:hypothetical protein